MGKIYKEIYNYKIGILPREGCPPKVNDMARKGISQRSNQEAKGLKELEASKVQMGQAVQGHATPKHCSSLWEHQHHCKA